MYEAIDNGRACWVDLSTTDVATAEEFYRDLLGWSIDHHEAALGEYLVGTIGGRPVAGMMAVPVETAPSAWTIHFHVNDLEMTIGALKAAGGSVIRPPFDIPGEARLSVVADPGGAVFALHAGAVLTTPYISAAVGAVGWVELMARDPSLAAGFYYQVFGWVATTADAGGIAYTTFEPEHSEPEHGEHGRADHQPADEHPPVAGMLPMPPEIPADSPDVWSAYFNVADCAAAAERVAALGGQVVKPPTETPMGPFAVLADPTGAVFQVMQYVEPSS